MRLFTAGFFTETCDLNPVPITGKEWLIAEPNSPEMIATEYGQMLELFREWAEVKDWSVVESICATALPNAGRITQSVYEAIRDRILEDLNTALPVDGVLLQLHGAAMAQGYDDCEGDLIKRIRLAVGPDVPIGVELDPHCHITERMMDNATLMVLYKTFCHTDRTARAVELFDLFVETVEGKIKPVMVLFDCRMIETAAFDEAYEPMKSFLHRVCTLEKESGVLSISPVHGYPLADIPEMGSKMLVITDNDQALADSIAETLGREFFGLRGQIKREDVDIESAINKTQRHIEKSNTPVVLSENSDSGGYGFTTDGTVLLRALLEAGVQNVAVGLMWDRQAVEICHAVGEGASVFMRIGGKASPLSGTPLDLQVEVERIYTAQQLNWQGEMTPCDTAVVRAGDTQLLLTSKRVLGSGLNAFIDMGIEPAEKQVLVLKFSYGQVDTDSPVVINVSGPCLDYKTLPFKNIQRPKWPWDSGVVL